MNNDLITKENTPDFLNDYFVNNAQITCGILNLDDHAYTVLYSDVNNKFAFIPPTTEEMYGYMEGMDLTSSSCIPGVNIKMCKASLEAVPDRFRHLFASSLYLRKFPNAWTCAHVTLLQKCGDKSNPGNLRPISQISIFAKILKKKLFIGNY